MSGLPWLREAGEGLPHRGGMHVWPAKARIVLVIYGSSLGLLGAVHDVQEHFRFAYAGTVFHSKEYKRGGKRDSTMFEVHDGGCFVIKRILEVTDTRSTANGEAVLLCGKVVRKQSYAGLSAHIADCFFSRSHPLIALKVSEISKPCVFVSFGDREDFICTVPNFIERD